MVVQVELHNHEQLDKAWRRLAKRDAKQASADPDHVPAAQQPEAVFLPQMLDEFLEVRFCWGWLTCARCIPTVQLFSCSVRFSSPEQATRVQLSEHELCATHEWWLVVVCHTNTKLLYIFQSLTVCCFVARSC